MSEVAGGRGGSAAPAGPGGDTAGSRLRQARKAQGLHIAALAAAIKVSPKKLEALESDRYEELPDATFTRALALTVCRHLKIDADPVLSLLPSAGQPTRLEHVNRGLNTPFRERQVQADGASSEAPWWGSPAVLVIGALLVAAAAFLWWPSPGQVGDTLARWYEQIGAVLGGRAVPGDGVAVPAASGESQGQAAPADTAVMASDEVAAAASGPAAREPVATEPARTEPVAAATPVSPDELPSGLLVLRARSESWIEVKDGNGDILLSRLVSAGESVGLDGRTPLRVKVGNAEGTDVFFRGQPFDMAPNTRDNVARLELR